MAEFNLLDSWREFLVRYFPTPVINIFIREAQLIDQENPVLLDEFIFSSKLLRKKTRDNEKWAGVYIPILYQAIAVAKKTQNISLIETLILRLQEFGFRR